MMQTDAWEISLSDNGSLMNTTPSHLSCSKIVNTHGLALHLVGFLACLLFFAIPIQSFAGLPQDSAATKGFQMLEDIQAAITELAERVTPSVVNIFPIRDRKNGGRHPQNHK